MAKQLLNTGVGANDGLGDSLRTGGTKINDNFNELYSILGDGDNLLTNDIDFGPNKLLHANSVSTLTNLSNIDPSSYPGLILQVEQTGALYYAYGGAWKRILSDTSDGSIANYDDPLSSVAYSGNYNELQNRPSVPTSITDLSDITDGSSGQVLTTDGTGNFTFRDIQATSIEFSAITSKPTTLLGYGIIDAFSGNYTDLTNKPVLFSGNYNDLVGAPAAVSDISDLTDTTNLLFSKSYIDLTNKPAIPSDINSLADSDNLLFSGSYNDLTNKPTLFTDLTSIQLTLGVNIDEFSNDSTLIDASQTSLITEFAAKTYIDQNIAEFSIVLDDLGVVVNAPGTSNLEYNNQTGIFSYTPPNLSSYLTSVAFNDLTSTPTTILGYGITDSPEVLTDLGISDGTVGQVLTTNGNGSFTFQDPGDQIGNFTLSSSTIDTDDSSVITITPAVVMSSDLTVDGNLTVAGDIITTAGGSPEIVSNDTITLTAPTGVIVNGNTSVKGDIIPDTTEAYDLGSATNRFRDLYLSGNTINLGGVPISVDSATATINMPLNLQNSIGVPNDVGMNGFYDLTPNFQDTGSPIDVNNSIPIPPMDIGTTIYAYSKVVFDPPLAGFGGGIEYNYFNFPSITNDGKTPPTIVADIDGGGNLLSLEIIDPGNATGLGETFLFGPAGNSSLYGCGLNDNTYPAPIVTAPGGTVTGNLAGTLTGDLIGSVFADDSTLLVDGVNGKIVGPIQTLINGIDTTTGGASTVSPTTLDLTSTILVLNSADTNDDSWLLPDGVEGQVIHLVPGTGAATNQHYVQIANWRKWDEGAGVAGEWRVVSGLDWIPFKFENTIPVYRSMATAVFVNGAWHTDTPWID